MALKHRSQPSTSAPVSITELKALLRSSGLRSTGARLAVLQYLHETGGPNSHGELFDALADRGFDRATIYRNLMDLAEVGIVSRTDLGDHVWRFELKKGARGENHTEEHPHFVCVDCGQVACLTGLDVSFSGSTGATKVPRSVSKNKVAIQIKGRCDTCS